ncbi:MAG: hypothetical protein MRY79_03425 [Alphaproteobacteria bacterium]|nr:hypothetical protein [Alphaproteobacteria bacterium]
MSRYMSLLGVEVDPHGDAAERLKTFPTRFWNSPDMLTGVFALAACATAAPVIGVPSAAVVLVGGLALVGNEYLKNIFAKAAVISMTNNKNADYVIDTMPELMSDDQVRTALPVHKAQKYAKADNFASSLGALGVLLMFSPFGGVPVFARNYMAYARTNHNLSEGKWALVPKQHMYD